MILVENSSFAPTPDSCDHYSNVLSAGSHPLTPFTPFDNNNSSPSASSAITAADEAYDLDLEEIDQLLFSDQEDQNSNSGVSSSSGSISHHSPLSEHSAHSAQLISGSDLLYGSYLAEEEEEDDSSFLELDLSDASSEEQDDDLSSLTPSVQRLFCSTSMSNYSTLSSSSVLSSTLLEQHHHQHQHQHQHQQQAQQLQQLQLQHQQHQQQLQEAAAVAQRQQQQQQHQLAALGGSERLSGIIQSVDTGRLFSKNAFANSLVSSSASSQHHHRNGNNSLFTSKASPYIFSGISSNTITSSTTQFDNISASGSSSSSTPSTPGAYHPQTSSSSSSTSSTASTLPSFSEIYSPRGVKTNNNFDCTGDFFKFEDAFSDNSCISAEADDNCAAAAAALQLAIEQFPSEQLLTDGAVTVSTTSASVASGQFDLLHPHIILKEEPMDSFVSTSANLNANVNTNQTQLCNFVQQQQQQQPKQEITQQTNEQQIKETDTMLFRADSPKPMRYHLHNLSMSVMQQQQQQQSVCDQAVPFDTDPFESDDTSMDRLADFEAQLIQQTAPMPLLSSIQGMQSLLAAGSAHSSASAAHSVASAVGDNLSNPLVMGGGVACGGSPSSHSANLFSRNSPIGNNAGGGGGKMRTTGLNRPHKAAMQICAVCGDVAACQHYGVLTCEGCKGFFKRTVQKNSKYTCLGNKDCTVDKRRRNRCQACRFQKCLSVGMVKEVVRTDSLKGRRGRLPSKPKNASEAAPAVPMTTITALMKAHIDTSNDKQNLDFSQYSDSVNLAGEEAQTHIDSQLLTMLNRSLNNLYAFMEKIPGFNEFSEHDRKVLFQNSCLELFALRMAYRIKPGSLYFIFSNNVVMHRNQFAASFGEWLPLIEELSNQLNAMELDISSFACLSALTVITGRCGVQDLGKVDELETKIISALKDHTMYHCEAQKKPNYFSRILSKLSELRTIGELGHRVVTQRLGLFTLATANADIRDLSKKLAISGTGLGSGTAAPFHFASSSSTSVPSNLNVRMETVEGANISSSNINIGSSSNLNLNPNSAASALPDLSCLDLPSISSFFKWQNMK